MAEKTPKIKITQVRSVIGCTKKQLASVQALGLRRIRHSVVHNDTPQIKGMISVVRHLVECEVVNDSAKRGKE